MMSKIARSPRPFSKANTFPAKAGLTIMNPDEYKVNTASQEKSKFIKIAEACTEIFSQKFQ